MGFEPTRGVNLCRFSRPVPSTARPPIQPAMSTFSGLVSLPKGANWWRIAWNAAARKSAHGYCKQGHWRCCSFKLPGRTPKCSVRERRPGSSPPTRRVIPAWVTIYDLGKTTHLDYGCVRGGDFRTWAAGNYLFASYYYVRGEVKAGLECGGDTICDTTRAGEPRELPPDRPPARMSRTGRRSRSCRMATTATGATTTRRTRPG